MWVVLVGSDSICRKHIPILHRDESRMFLLGMANLHRSLSIPSNTTIHRYLQAIPKTWRAPLTLSDRRFSWFLHDHDRYL